MESQTRHNSDILIESSKENCVIVDQMSDVDTDSESTIKEPSRKRSRKSMNKSFVNEVFRKCKGYDSKIEKLYKNFPFQVFDAESEWVKDELSKIVFENGVFHSLECSKKIIK